MDATVINGVFMAAGAVMSQVVSAVINLRGKRKDQEATFREDLWREVNALRERVGLLQGEVDEWRGKHYALLGSNAELQGKVAAMGAELDRVRSSPPSCPICNVYHLAHVAAAKVAANGGAAE